MATAVADRQHRNGSKPAVPTYDLVKEDPPEQRRTEGLGERVRPLLIELAKSGDGEWYRIATYPGRGAGIATSRLKKLYPAGFEFRSAQLHDLDESRIYARCTDPAVEL